MAIGIIVASVFIPLILIFMVAHPRDKGLEKDGHHPEADREDHALKEALRVQDLAWAQTDWTLAPPGRADPSFLPFVLLVLLHLGREPHILVTHQIAFALDLGFDRTYASDVISLGGITFGLGCLVSLLSERWGREFTFTLGSLSSISGVLALLAMEGTQNPWLLHYYAIMFGLGFGMCFPILASATTDLFQGPGAGATIGAVWFSFAMGGAMGPGWAAGCSN